MPAKMSEDKRAALRALGAELVIAPNEPPSHPDNFQNVARRMAEEHGWFLTDQFANPANVAVHETTTGPEILAQCGGRVGAFVAGAGTGGTLSGVGRFLKRQLPGVRIVLADPVGSGLARWVETGEVGAGARYAVEGIGSSAVPANLHRDVIDAVEVVSDAESYATARRLIAEEGLLVGGSAGTNVAAALRVAARGDVAGPVVTVGCDSWDRYLSQDWLRETPARVVDSQQEALSQRRRRHHAGVRLPEQAVAIAGDAAVAPVTEGARQDPGDATPPPRRAQVPEHPQHRVGVLPCDPAGDEYDRVEALRIDAVRPRQRRAGFRLQRREAHPRLTVVLVGEHEAHPPSAETADAVEEDRRRIGRGIHGCR